MLTEDSTCEVNPTLPKRVRWVGSQRWHREQRLRSIPVGFFLRTTKGDDVLSAAARQGRLNRVVACGFGDNPYTGGQDLMKHLEVLLRRGTLLDAIPCPTAQSDRSPP